VVAAALKRFLHKHRIIALDSGPLIYFVEEHPRYSPLCEVIFENVESGAVKASTSTLTLLETLARPYQLKNDELVLKFYSLLTTYPHLTWVPTTLNVADLAARLRAGHHLKTPGAIQAASAITSGATGFVCNDRAFRKISELDCLILDDYC
jgi:predicted nucleic acid-binding protein